MEPVIRQDDTSREGGGRVLEGHYLCHDQPITCQGDAVRCNPHRLTRIAEGSDLFEVDDCPVAMDGHRCACGCTLISSMPDTSVAS